MDRAIDGKDLHQGLYRPAGRMFRALGRRDAMMLACPPYGNSSFEMMCLMGLRAARGRNEMKISIRHIVHSAVSR